MAIDHRPARWPGTAAEWFQFTLGLALVFALFQWLGARLGSDRGQAGLLVGALVVSACVFVECVLFGGTVSDALRRLGLGVPTWPGSVTAVIVCALLLLTVPIHVALTRSTVAWYPGWFGLIPGLFAQAGIAEETLFRGYGFRHIRQGRSFRHAASLAAGPFALVHVWLFATMPWPVAFVSVLLAIVISFPLSYLFELGGNTIWAPALVHFVVQAGAKVFAVDGTGGPFVILWMSASAVIPYAAFLRRRGEGSRISGLAMRGPL